MADAVTIEPSDAVAFEAPFTAERTAELRLRNGGDQRATFKMKSTRLTRFKMRPAFGFVEPKQEALVKLVCRPFDVAKDGLTERDRFTVMIAPAPAGATSASSVWRHGSATEPKTPRRCPIPVRYGTAKGAPPPPKPAAPAKAEPPKAEPPKPEPPKVEPPKPEPPKAEPPKMEPPKAEPVEAAEPVVAAEKPAEPSKEAPPKKEAEGEEEGDEEGGDDDDDDGGEDEE